MKYGVYDRDKVPMGKPVWALAYDINDDTEHRNLICKPVLGEIVNRTFYPYKKGTTERRQSGSVTYWGRVYADTYEEAVEMYNEYVQDRIDNLYRMIESAKLDMITQEKV